MPSIDKTCFFYLNLPGSSEENNIESIIDNGKAIGDSSADGCDISSQTATTVNQTAQLSIATVSTANIDGQQVNHVIKFCSFVKMQLKFIFDQNINHF